MITEFNVKRILLKDFNFDAPKIKKLDNFVKKLLIYNKKHNLISKNTEKQIWDRHILDSAQLIKFIDVKSCSGIADLGTGGGFPGIVLAIYFQNFNFHVKLYEKSPVKSSFLINISNILGLNCKIICNDINSVKIDSNYIVTRAFKKLEAIIQVSREIAKKPHKLIVLKGQNAHKDLKKAFKKGKYDYKLENSITNKDSKIIIFDFKK